MAVLGVCCPRERQPVLGTSSLAVLSQHRGPEIRLQQELEKIFKYQSKIYRNIVNSRL